MKKFQIFYLPKIVCQVSIVDLIWFNILIILLCYFFTFFLESNCFDYLVTILCILCEIGKYVVTTNEY